MTRESDVYFLFMLRGKSFFLNLVNEKFAIIHIRIVNPAGDYEQTFNYKWPYALVSPHRAVLDLLKKLGQTDRIDI